jgi:lysozyme
MLYIMSKLKTSQNGLDLIRHFEGFEPKVYLCSAGKKTIGIGTLIDTKDEEWLLTAKITETQAFDLLKKDLVKFEKQVNNLVKVEINQNQFDALISFVYNFGSGALKESTLLKKLNVNPNDKTIAEEFLKWNKARVKGVLTPVDGLTRRRKAESKLYFTEIKK